MAPDAQRCCSRGSWWGRGLRPWSCSRLPSVLAGDPGLGRSRLRSDVAGRGRWGYTQTRPQPACAHTTHTHARVNSTRSWPEPARAQRRTRTPAWGVAHPSRPGPGSPGSRRPGRGCHCPPGKAGLGSSDWPMEQTYFTSFSICFQREGAGCPPFSPWILTGLTALCPHSQVRPGGPAKVGGEALPIVVCLAHSTCERGAPGLGDSPRSVLSCQKHRRGTRR